MHMVLVGAILSAMSVMEAWGRYRMRCDGYALARERVGRGWMVPPALVKLGGAQSAFWVVPIRAVRGAVEDKGWLPDVIVKKNQVNA